MTQPRNSIDEIIEGLALAPFMGVGKQARGSAPIFKIPGGPLASCFLNLPPDNALSAGIELPPFDILRLRSACVFLAQAGEMANRDGWRDLLLFPLSEEAKRRPEKEAELK